MHTSLHLFMSHCTDPVRNAVLATLSYQEREKAIAEDVTFEQRVICGQTSASR